MPYLDYNPCDRCNAKYESKHSSISVVSFTSVLAMGDTTQITINDGEIVIFRDIITNIGDAYSNTTGKFVTPYKGTYQFTAAIVNWGSGNLYSCITYIYTD